MVSFFATVQLRRGDRVQPHPVGHVRRGPPLDRVTRTWPHLGRSLARGSPGRYLFFVQVFGFAARTGWGAGAGAAGAAGCVRGPGGRAGAGGGGRRPAATGQPWLVSIHGDPGIGKTSLARRGLTAAGGAGPGPDGPEGVVGARRSGRGRPGLRAGRPVAAGGRCESRAVLAAPVPTVPPLHRSRWARACSKRWGNAAAAGPVAIVVDDLQWADLGRWRRCRSCCGGCRWTRSSPSRSTGGPSDRLAEAAQRMLRSIDNQLEIPLGGLGLDDVAAMADAMARAAGCRSRAAAAPGDGRAPAVPAHGAEPRGPASIPGLRSGCPCPGRWPRPSVTSCGRCRRRPGASCRCWRSWTSRYRWLSSVRPRRSTRPAQRSRPRWPQAWWTGRPRSRSARYECATCWSGTPSTPALAPRRRELHGRAALVVSESASWQHRVAALEQPDEDLAADLERWPPMRRTTAG